MIELLESRIAPAAVPLVIDQFGSADGRADELVLLRDGDLLMLTVNGASAGAWAFAEISEISVIGSADDDTLTLDFAGGELVPEGGLTFDGAAGFDILSLRNGSFVTEVATTYDSHSGRIEVDGRTIHYAGIEPVNDTSQAMTFIFNAGAGSNLFNFTNGPVVSGDQTIAISGPGFETINFANKTNVILNAGGGADVINLDATVAAAGLATLNIHGHSETNTGDDDAADTFNINGTIPGVAVSLTGGGGGDLFILANGVSLGAGTINGGSGVNTLSYSAWTSPVAVNLGLSVVGLDARLSGSQEEPNTASAATGQATFSGYNAATKTVNIAIEVTGIPAADVTGFHLHRGMVDVNGPIIVDLGTASLVPTDDGFSFVASGVAIPAIHEAEFLGALTYVNVHTAAFPNGAIRGQVLPIANLNLTSGTATGTGGISNIQNVFGGAAADSLVGSFALNLLSGGAGNDILLGGPGGDTVAGGADSDLFVWSNGDGSDVMDGEGGDDIVQVNGALTGNDQFLLQVNPGAPSRLRFDRTNLGLFNLDIGTVEALQFNTYGGDDVVTVDFAGGNPIPVNGLRFDGRTGFETGDDRLVLQRSAGTFLILQEHYTAEGRAGGVLNLGDRTVTFSNVARVDDTVPAASFVFPTPGGGSLVNLVNGPQLNAAPSAQLNGGTDGFVPINFVNKTSVTIFGTAGEDVVAVNNTVQVPGLSNLTIDLGAGNDRINVKAANATGAIVLNGGSGADRFRVAASPTAEIHVDGGEPARSPGDVLDFETNGIAAVLGEGVVTSSGALRDVTFEAVETVFLSNRTLRLLSPTVAVFTDTDGDLVRIKVNKGTLDLTQFTLALNATDTGAQLQHMVLTDPAFNGTKVNIKAQRSDFGGDGFVNVGFLDATSVNLGAVKIDGDLGQIDAGTGDAATPAVKSLAVQSLGLVATSTQNGTASLNSSIFGSLGKLKVARDIHGAMLNVAGADFASAAIGRIGQVFIGGSLIGGGFLDAGNIIATGSIGPVTILGSMLGGEAPLSGAISSGGSIGPVKIGGSMVGGGGPNSGSIATGSSQGVPTNIVSVAVGGDLVGGAGDFSGSIVTFTGGSIGPVKLGGSLVATTNPLNGIQSDSTLGPVKIRGDVRGTDLVPVVIAAQGVLNPETAAETLAIKSVTVGGRVQHAEILAGYKTMIVATIPEVISDLVGTNPDVRIGRVTAGTWIASSLAAGVSVGGDGVFGTADDTAIVPISLLVEDNPAIVSKIARITILGQAIGIVAGPEEHFGFVAQQVGAFSVGGTAFPLAPGAGNDDLDANDPLLLVGPTENLRVHEVAAP